FQVEVLEHAEVPFVDPRAADEIATGVAVKAEDRHAEGVCVEPLRNRLRSLDWRAGYQVRAVRQADVRARETDVIRAAALERGDSVHLPAAGHTLRPILRLAEERQLVSVIDDRHMRAIERREAALGAPIVGILRRSPKPIRIGQYPREGVHTLEAQPIAESAVEIHLQRVIRGSSRVLALRDGRPSLERSNDLDGDLARV